jgi:polyisoprenoid-binding protein YceI
MKSTIHARTLVIDTLLLSLAILSFSIVHADQLVFSPNAEGLHFTAIGKPKALKIVGKGNGPQGKLNINTTEKNKTSTTLSGSLEVDLTQLTTDLSLRDQHMKNKYLEVDKFPKAVLTIQNLPYQKGNTQEGTFEGDLQLKNTHKKTLIHYRLDPSGKLDADFTIKLSDFNVTIPSFAGITIADEVTLTLNTSASLDINTVQSKN